MISRRTPLSRGSAPQRKTRVKPKKRKPSEFARIYGSKLRVAWIKSQPCAWRTSTCGGEIQNAHTETGGMGYKAGYETIVPLCAYHHQDYDQHRPPFATVDTRQFLMSCAVDFERRWQEFRDAHRGGTE